MQSGIMSTTLALVLARAAGGVHVEKPRVGKQVFEEPAGWHIREDQVSAVAVTWSARESQSCLTTQSHTIGNKLVLSALAMTVLVIKPWMNFVQSDCS